MRFNFLIVLSLVLTSCQNEIKQPTPQVFELGNISTSSVELSPTFSKDGNELYFVRSIGEWGKAGMKSSIYFSVKENGKWSAPQLTSFSGEFSDSAPHLTADGKTLYFTSKRPINETDQGSKDIWKVEKDESGNWGIPTRLSDHINSERSEYSPRTDKDGNLYFASNREGGFGQGDLYMAQKTDTGFASPVNLGNTVNSENGEWNLEISDDGNILIFESSGRDEGLSPYGDLYISFKENDLWSAPQHLKEINTTGSDLYAEITDNNKTLYYVSSDSLPSVNTNIYTINFKKIVKKYNGLN